MAENMSCRRCSVIRVNALCRLYDEGFYEGNERSLKQLTSLTKISLKRGYKDSELILSPGLSSDYVRRICWNISSLLTDQDLNQHGVSFDGRRR